MNSLSFIHPGSSEKVNVFLETGLEKDAGASESSSARRERDMCRWRRGADKVMIGAEQELSAQAQFSHLNNSCRNARELSKLRRKPNTGLVRTRSGEPC
jgi:hypothetical protein